MDDNKKIRNGILIGIGIFVAAVYAVVDIIFHKTYQTFHYDYDTTIAHWDYYKDRYQRRPVKFLSGANELTGYVYEAKKPKGLMVFSAGIWSGPEEYLMLVTWFVDHGWSVFTYNYTAYNGSQGKWLKGLPQAVKDLDAALIYIDHDKTLKDMPRVLVGHSLGAYATAAVLALKHDNIKGAVTMSGFNDPLTMSLDGGRDIIGPVAYVMAPMIELFNIVLFGFKNGNRTAVQGINASGIPVLVIHGQEDDFIQINRTSIVHVKSKITNPNVSYWILDEPGHCNHNNYITSRSASEYVSRVNAEFEEIKKTYPLGKVPASRKRLFYKNVNKARANEPNEALCRKIDSFLTAV